MAPFWARNLNIVNHLQLPVHSLEGVVQEGLSVENNIAGASGGASAGLDINLKEIRQVEEHGDHKSETVYH